MLGIYKMNQFHWVSNVEFEHLLRMIQKHLLDSRNINNNNSKNKYKTLVETCFSIIDIGKTKFHVMFYINVLF
jgi:hypothetical protein